MLGSQGQVDIRSWHYDFIWTFQFCIIIRDWNDEDSRSFSMLIRRYLLFVLIEFALKQANVCVKLLWG